MTLSDDQLLEAVARLYAAYDPAPDDLAEGALARLAVEDLEDEYELLTLVERVDLAAGVRSSTDAVAEGDDSTVALEFAGTSYRVLVRISTVDGHRRLDGWVVPAMPMRILLGPPGGSPSRTGSNADISADADEDGRFEFSAPPPGEARLWLLPRVDDDASSAPPFVTPPFLI
jgi:hypothetical protein